MAEDNSEIANLLFKMGSTYDRMDNLESALSYYNQSLEMKRRLKSEAESEMSELAALLNSLGGCCLRLDKLDEADKYLNEAIEASKKTSQPVVLSEALYSLGLVFEKQNNYQTAVEHFQQALEIRKDTDYNLAQWYHKIGEMWSKLGKQDKSLEAYLNAEERYIKLDEEDFDQANLLTDIGSIYYSMNQLDKSLEYHNKGLEMKKRLIKNDEARIEIAHSYIGIGLVHKKESESAGIESDEKKKLLREALTQFSSALAIYLQIYADKDHANTATALNQIGLTYEAMSQYETALEFFNRELEMRKKLLNSSNNSLAKIEDKTPGRMTKALDYIKQSYDAKKKTSQDHVKDLSNYITSMCSKKPKSNDT